jgi:hypothetical protein
MSIFILLCFALAQICRVSCQCQAGYAMQVGTVDSVILVDSDNSCIRTLSFSGDQAILAGIAGSTGYVNGPGVSSLFKSPTNLAVAPDNSSVIILDYGNNLLRRVDISSGVVSTFAGSTYSTINMDTVNIDGSGSSATFYNMRGISLSQKSNRFFVSVPFPVLRVITYPVPVVSSLLGVVTGNLGVVDGVLGVDGLVSGTCTYFPSPDETFFISSDTTNRNIRIVDLASLQVTTLAGSPGNARVSGCTDGVGSNALFASPNKIIFSSSLAQDVFIADIGNYGIRKLNIATSTVSTLVGTCPYSSPTGIDGVRASFYITDMVLSSDGIYIYAGQKIYAGIRRVEVSTGMVTTIGGGSSLPISNIAGYTLALKPAVSSCSACVSGKYSLDGSICIVCPAGAFCPSVASSPVGCLSGDFWYNTINHTPLIFTGC